MEVTINVPDQLAAEARAHGVSVEVYVEEILARQALDATSEERLQSVRAAIERILELRKGSSSQVFERGISSTKATSSDGRFRGRSSGRGRVTPVWVRAPLF